MELLYLLLCRSEAFLPTTHTMHELIYELVRYTPALTKHRDMTASLTLQPSKRSSTLVDANRSARITDAVLAVAEHYQSLIAQAGVSSAEAAMAVVAKNIEQDGVYGLPSPDGVLDCRDDTEELTGFRYLYSDVLALMP
ncbi:hypothetical protein PUNSTDRAFT_117591 [Punctularia strigosozonata HHB-11173 SS5]|uniref:uncharacterized protein n=1 Tax=Punctularia strigosozonata (strain HHB-11173) TaxID=741275 RepID=UPI0004416A21|nr:uncharacterized protein PUNSTDRAFT_117591 [Punctularia strigosozonata HHB-11173 SS5]EIN13969.1 hypothetical protein PUNSTDRAFT_117591 [Punctularia strigosozonata HHB-11173 SS5]